MVFWELIDLLTGFNNLYVDGWLFFVGDVCRFTDLLFRSADAGRLAGFWVEGRVLDFLGDSWPKSIGGTTAA